MHEVYQDSSKFFQDISRLGISLHDSTKPIYKYMSFETAKIVLESMQIRYRAPSTFNDPFEFNLDCIDTEIGNKEIRTAFVNSIKKTHDFSANKAKDTAKKIDKVLLKKISSKLFSDTRNTSLVFCASEINNDILMWSHYADSHKGICLGIHLPPFNKDVDCITMKVNYAKTISPRKFYIENEYDRAISLLYWIYTKADCWKYEKEVRCYIKNFENHLGIDEGKFIDVGLDKSQLVEVYFGMKVEKKDIQEFLELIKSKALKLKIRKMNREKGKFTLREEKL